MTPGWEVDPHSPGLLQGPSSSGVGGLSLGSLLQSLGLSALGAWSWGSLCSEVIIHQGHCLSKSPRPMFANPFLHPQREDLCKLLQDNSLCHWRPGQLLGSNHLQHDGVTAPPPYVILPGNTSPVETAGRTFRGSSQCGLRWQPSLLHNGGLL